MTNDDKQLPLDYEPQPPPRKDLPIHPRIIGAAIPFTVLSIATLAFNVIEIVQPSGEVSIAAVALALFLLAAEYSAVIQRSTQVCHLITFFAAIGALAAAVGMLNDRFDSWNEWLYAGGTLVMLLYAAFGHWRWASELAEV